MGVRYCGLGFLSNAKYSLDGSFGEFRFYQMEMLRLDLVGTLVTH